MSNAFNTRKFLAVIALGLALPLGAYADNADKDAIRKSITAAYPAAPAIKEINTTPVGGLYEVHLGSEILYSDKTGAYIIQGSMISTAAKKSVTEERLAVLNKVNFADLPLAQAVVTKIGNGADKVVVFADPNCGYCKKFERETVPQMKDVTIYTILIPILSPDSKEKSKAVWCAADRSQAWMDLMQKDTPAPVPGEKCDSAVIDKNLELAKALGVTGTPTIFFENGTRVPGAIPLDAVNAKIKEARAAKVAKK